ncbi:MAG: transposase [Candidatus Competibacteraceae bacterium]|nr:transposase [Candidatus Competibacteraceae bacterium]
MAEIIALLSNVSQVVTATELRQLLVIVPAVLAMTGQVTMLNTARWTGKGGSYPTIRRFYNAQLMWLRINWALSCHQLKKVGGIFLLVGDETVVTKSGKQTYGLDRYFSSIYKRAVPGLAFFGISLVSVEEQSSTMMLMEQLQKEESTSEKSRPAAKKSKGKKQGKGQPKAKGGRPKGSKNKNRRDVELPAYLQNLQGYFQQVLDLVGDALSIPYCVLDGAFGNNNALQMVRRLGVHLISKLAKNSALYFPYSGEQNKVGARRKYGKKVDYQQLPERCLKHRITQDGVRTESYQMHLLSKSFPDLLNVVIIVKTKLDTHERAHVVLFSSDLALDAEQLILYYRLRFQIEFNFRAAKQYFGLEDFMNVKQRPVYNAANFALFMTNIANRLVRQRRQQVPEFGIHDLKAEFRGRFYAAEILKHFPEFTDSGFIERLLDSVSSIGAVHP